MKDLNHNYFSASSRLSSICLIYVSILLFNLSFSSLDLAQSEISLVNSMIRAECTLFSTFELFLCFLASLSFLQAGLKVSSGLWAHNVLLLPGSPNRLLGSSFLLLGQYFPGLRQGFPVELG